MDVPIASEQALQWMAIAMTLMGVIVFLVMTLGGERATYGRYAQESWFAKVRGSYFSEVHRTFFPLTVESRQRGRIHCS